MICPACGELVIAFPGDTDNTLAVPAHPDRLTPFVECAVRAHAIPAGKIRLR